MPSIARNSLALLVYHQPYQNRVARADIDIALAAAALDFDIHVYFTGRSILQLATQRNNRDALLPGGYRAWAALPDLADTTAYVEQQWMDYCCSNQVGLVMDVEVVTAAEMKLGWRRSSYVMVL